MSNSPQLVVALPKVTYYFWLSICIQKLTVGVEGLLVLKVDLVFGDILKKNRDENEFFISSYSQSRKISSRLTT